MNTPHRLFPTGAGTASGPTDVEARLPAANETPASTTAPPPPRKGGWPAGKPRGPRAAAKKSGGGGGSRTEVGSFDAKWQEHEQHNLGPDAAKPEARRNYYAGGLDMLWLLIDFVPVEDQKRLMAEAQRGLLRRD